MSSSSLDALRRQLQEEEAANEVVALKAELAALKKVHANDDDDDDDGKKKKKKKKAPTTTTNVGESPKKKKQRTTQGKEKMMSALAALPVATAAAIRPPNRYQVLLEEDEEEDEEEPKKTPFDGRWRVLCEATGACQRFQEKMDSEVFKSWKQAKPCGEWCQGLPHCYALDCEMCVCEDPVSKIRTKSELVRVSVVDGTDRESSFQAASTGGSDDVVLDTLVQPSLPVVDYVTWIHGIDEAALASVEFQRQHAQDALQLLVCDRCVLVGHALHNDLAALQFQHRLLVDTSALFSITDAPESFPALRDVAGVLPPAAKMDMLKRAHDSTVDARSALLAAYYLLDNPTLGLPHPIPRASSAAAAAAAEKKIFVAAAKNEHKKPQLFVHRIPKEFDADTVKRAFQRTTAIAVDALTNFQLGAPYSKLTLTFRSPDHVDLAFAALGDSFEDDNSGRPQKKLFLTTGLPSLTSDDSNGTTTALKKGPYCKVRRV